MNKLKLPNLYNCSIAIIGMGYVGLPLALEIAKNKKCLLTNKKLKRKVLGYDFDKLRINQLKEGIDRNRVFNKKSFKNNQNIEFTFNKNKLIDIDIFIVTVPTPLNKYNEPDLKCIEEASKNVGIAIKDSIIKNQIVIYESTVYPGTTEDICIPIIEKFSNKKYNLPNYKNTFYCGYSPERINPGDIKNTIQTIKKVTSGSKKLVSNWIDKFYGSFIKAGTFKAKNIRVAEAAKIIENTQRDINIALVNELAILFNKLNIDTNAVLDAANTKWNFHRYKTGLVGGHCIGVDPYYLTYKAKEIGYDAELISAGRKINDFMHQYLFNQVLIEIKKRKTTIKKEKVLILGVSYKENCSDIRNSQILLLIKNIQNLNMDITLVDPLVDSSQVFREIGIKSVEEIPKKQKYSIIIIALKHKQFNYLKNKDIKSLSDSNSIIFDITNHYFGKNIKHL